jgi:hypothetical protein
VGNSDTHLGVQLVLVFIFYLNVSLVTGDVSSTVWF